MFSCICSLVLDSDFALDSAFVFWFRRRVHFGSDQIDTSSQEGSVANAIDILNEHLRRNKYEDENMKKIIYVQI